MIGEMEIGSVIKFCYDHNPVTVYTTDVPEGMDVPSMYFPPPISVDSRFTSSTFSKAYTLPVRIFHKTDQGAMTAAETIADSLRLKRFEVPRVNQAGTGTGRVLLIEQADIRLIDDRVAELNLKWSSRYNYVSDPYEKIGKVFLDIIQIQIGG